MCGARRSEAAGGSGWICVCSLLSSLTGGRGHEPGPPVLPAGSGERQQLCRGLQQPGRAGDAEGPRGTGRPALRATDSLLASQSSCCVQPFSHATVSKRALGSDCWGLSPSIGSVTLDKSLNLSVSKTERSSLLGRNCTSPVYSIIVNRSTVHSTPLRPRLPPCCSGLHPRTTCPTHPRTP